MNTMELLGLEENDTPPAKKIYKLVDEMHETAMEEQKRVLISASNLHEIGYRKGKVAALDEVLQMLKTGKISD